MKVRLFAQQRQQVGWSEREVEVPEGSKVADLIAALGHDYPSIASAARHLVAAINSEYVEPNAVLSPGDEVALIPPVSGGALPAHGEPACPESIEGSNHERAHVGRNHGRSNE